MTLALQSQVHSTKTEHPEDVEFSHHELLSLSDRFSHDIRTPLTVIDEFAAMLADDTITGPDERRHALALISGRTAETLSLVELLETLIRCGCGAITPVYQDFQARHVLQTAVTHLDHLDGFRREDVHALPTADSAPVHCDARLAADCVIQMWNWMRKVQRKQELELHLRAEAALTTVTFLVGRRHFLVDHAPSPEFRFSVGDVESTAMLHQDPGDLRLKAVFELGHRAGGDVIVIGESDAVILRLPAGTGNYQIPKELEYCRNE